MRKTILATASALAISIVPALAAGGEMPGAPVRGGGGHHHGYGGTGGFHGGHMGGGWHGGRGYGGHRYGGGYGGGYGYSGGYWGSGDMITAGITVLNDSGILPWGYRHTNLLLSRRFFWRC